MDLGSLLLGCTVCYGDPASPMSKGAVAGVIVLGGAIGSLLIAFASLFFYWMKRARAIDAAAAAKGAPAFAESGRAVPRPATR